MHIIVSYKAKEIKILSTLRVINLSIVKNRCALFTITFRYHNSLFFSYMALNFIENISIIIRINHAISSTKVLRNLAEWIHIS